MTVAADIAKCEGALRRYFLKVSGLPYVFNQRVADPTGDDSPLGPYGAAPNGLRGKVHPIDADCVACWRFDEAAASDDAVDATGNGHTGRLARFFNQSAVAALGTHAVFGGSRNMVDLEPLPGVDEKVYFSVANHADLQPDVFTAAAWLYVLADPLGDTGKIIWKGNGGSLDETTVAAWHLGQRATTPWDFYAQLRTTTGPTTTTVYAGTRPALGVHHVAMTFDATTLCLYVDGALANSATIAAAPDTVYYVDQDVPGGDWVSPDLRLDSNSSKGSYELDDIALYDAAKSALWIADIYSGGIGGLNCLRVPGSEATTSLDLGTMRTESSSMVFELDDIEDPDG